MKFRERQLRGKYTNRARSVPIWFACPYPCHPAPMLFISADLVNGTRVPSRGESSAMFRESVDFGRCFR
jgi:hypothetical protein